MERYVCIHGHFYQPPRENAWLEAIELQDSAYPFHDWNERVAAECYAPNTASRVLDERGRIVEIVNNYSRISFNVGPTLLEWMEAHAPEIYEGIIRADHESRERFSGHGSALAQAYNHMIMPLANARDRRTQVNWGLRDFERRFGRRPEGMWLPETAVDVDTLEALAEAGTRFTILAPHQAGRVRSGGGQPWRDVGGNKVDPARPYVQRLPSGRSIVLFFYDGPVSRAVAFEKLLANGERFASRLTNAFSDQRNWPQLIHIATDGESYGHHHYRGEMALSYALKQLESNGHAILTNYGEYLDRHPPTHEVEIIEATSWSCAHGIERWRGDCGCHTGGQPGWNQAWRAPLREALDRLRDSLGPEYEKHAGALLRDPWAARDDYIAVILDRSPEALDRFIQSHAARALTDEERTRALELLELQRHAMLMYTSCGWFFNELSGIETVQVIQYAGRALQLAGKLFDEDFESPFLEGLDRARSNIPEHGGGREVYDKFVRRAMVYLPKVGAHYAVTSLFEDYKDRARIYCYSVDVEDRRVFQAGRAKMAVGRARVSSGITCETAALSFAALRFGDHHVNGGVRKTLDEQAYKGLIRELSEAFDRADFPEIIRLLDKHFQAATYSLRSLFRDEQRRIVDRILAANLTEAENTYRHIYENRATLMRFVSELDIPLPKAFRMTADLVLNAELRRALEDPEPGTERVHSLLERVRESGIDLDDAGLAFIFTGTLERLAADLQTEPSRLEALTRLEAAVRLANSMPFEVNVWTVQNVYYDILRNSYPDRRSRAEQGDAAAREWVAPFVALGNELSVAVE